MQFIPTTGAGAVRADLKAKGSGFLKKMKTFKFVQTAGFEEDIFETAVKRLIPSRTM